MFTRTADPTRPGRPGSASPGQGGQTAGQAQGQPQSPPHAAPEPPPRRNASPRPASILGVDLAFDGRISGEGEVHVEGLVRGEIEVARLLVASGARVEGMIRSDHVEVRGRVVGDIEARTVKLYETARVEGDILHEQLSIETGAFLEGRLHRFQAAEPAPTVEMQPLLEGPGESDPEPA